MSMRVWLVLVAGCSIPATEFTPASGGVDGALTCLTTLGFVPANFDPCMVPPTTDTLTLATGTYTFDTDALTLTDGSGAPVSAHTLALVQGITSAPQLALIIADTIDIQPASTLNARGARAFVLLGLHSVTVDGNVDVSAAGTTAGPGAGADTDCTAITDGDGFGAAGTYSDSGVGQGGGGGGFGLKGGSSTTSTPAAAGGKPNGMTTLVPLRGGCHGGNGVNGGFNPAMTGQAQGGMGGGGGGAVQITTAQLVVNGQISAAGGGGGGGEAISNLPTTNVSGAGGGGAGGSCLLDAATIQFGATAKLTANGGSGGDPGSGNGKGLNGVDGHKSDGTQAPYATYAGCGGALSGAACDAFARGGGGAVGRIHLRITTIVGSTLFSPPAQ
jgi:hypothetical protein